jgi:short subunit dehydrogenase-like uncharacterized protein
MDLLIYGSYGYTGDLTARAAAAAGETPTLAGRSRPKVQHQATEPDLPSRTRTTWPPRRPPPTSTRCSTPARTVLDGGWEPGFSTPAGVYGPDLVLEIDCVDRTDEEPVRVVSR